MDISPKSAEKNNLTFDELKNYCSCWWASIYKAEIIKKHKIYFPQKALYGEDFVFLLLFLFYSKKYVFTDETSYFHYARKGSICAVTDDIKRKIYKKFDYEYGKKVIAKSSEDKNLKELFM